MDTNSLLPPILDVCCGGKMFYFDKQDSRVLFQDIREFETTLCDGRIFNKAGCRWGLYQYGVP